MIYAQIPILAQQIKDIEDHFTGPVYLICTAGMKAAQLAGRKRLLVLRWNEIAQKHNQKPANLVEVSDGNRTAKI